MGYIYIYIQRRHRSEPNCVVVSPPPLGVSVVLSFFCAEVFRMEMVSGQSTATRNVG